MDNRLNNKNSGPVTKETDAITAAKMKVYFVINDAIQKHADIDIEDQGPIKDFIYNCLFPKTDKNSYVSVFLSHTLIQIEELIQNVIVNLRSKKIFGFYVDRTSDYSDTFRRELLKLTGEKVLHLQDKLYKFDPILKEIEKKQGPRSICEEELTNLITAINQCHQLQIRLFDRIEEICDRVELSIKKKNSDNNNFKEKVEKVRARLFEILDHFMQIEIKNHQSLIIRNRACESTIDTNINEILKPYESVEYEENIVTYFTLICQKELLEEKALSLGYHSLLTKSNLQTSKFTNSNINEAITNSEIIKKLNDDIINLNNQIEYKQFQSFTSKSAVLNQLVSLDKNPKGFYQHYKEVSFTDYISNKQKYQKVVNNKLSVIHEKFNTRISELFSKNLNLIQIYSELKNSVEKCDNSINTYIQTTKKSIFEDLDIHAELKSRFTVNALNKQQEMFAIIDQLQNAPNIFLDASISIEDRISKFENLISSNEEKLNEFKNYTSDRQELSNNIDYIKNVIEQNHAIEKELGEVQLPEIKQFNNVYPLSTDEITTLKSYQLTYDLQKISYNGKIQTLFYLKDRILDEKNKVDTDICKKFVAEKLVFDTMQKEIIESISNINNLIETANLLNDTRNIYANSLNDEIIRAHDSIETISSSIKVFNKHISTLETDLKSSELCKEVEEYINLLSKKLENANEQISEAEKIFVRLNDKIPLTENEINECKVKADNILTTLEIPTSDEIDSIAPQSERLNLFNELMIRYNTSLKQYNDIEARFSTLNKLFGEEVNVAEYAVNTKFHHDICKELFLEAASKISGPRTIIESKLKSILQLIKDNVSSKDDIQELLITFKTEFETLKNAQSEYSNLLSGLTDRNKSVDHFKFSIANKDLNLDIIREEQCLKLIYDKVVAYLDTSIKNGHIQDPGFDFKNLQNPQDQHNAIKRIQTYARQYKPKGNEEQIGISNACKDDLVTACDRQPPAPDDIDFKHENLISKKIELSFSEKIKGHIGAVIGAITGGISGALLGGGLGAFIGFFLVPVTFGASIPLGAAIGAVVGGVVAGGLAGAGIGAAIGHCCVDSCYNVDDENEAPIFNNSNPVNDKDYPFKGKNSAYIRGELKTKPGSSSEEHDGPSQKYEHHDENRFDNTHTIDNSHNTADAFIENLRKTQAPQIKDINNQTNNINNQINNKI